VGRPKRRANDRREIPPRKELLFIISKYTPRVFLHAQRNGIGTIQGVQHHLLGNILRHTLVGDVVHEHKTPFIEIVKYCMSSIAIQ